MIVGLKNNEPYVLRTVATGNKIKGELLKNEIVKCIDVL